MIKYLIYIWGDIMASFVIHYIAGEEFLKLLSKTRKLTEKEKNNFRLGNLIVDSLDFEEIISENLTKEEIIKINKEYRKKKIEKKLCTHFRDKDGLNLCVNLPNLDKFMNKYRALVLKDFSALGYLFHLYTDKIFFKNLYENVISCLDKNRNLTNILKDNVYVKVKKDNKIYSVDDFWNSKNKCIYDDYTKMNRYLFERYNIDFSKNNLQEFANKYFINPGIEEVDYNSISEVLEKTEKYINESKNLDDNDLKVFKEEDILSFIPLVVESFYEIYYEEINYLLKNNLLN